MKLIKSKLLNNTSLTHAFTCRSSRNIAFHVNDNKNSVISNHQSLSAQLHYDYEKLIHMRQIHSNKVVHVCKTDSFKTPIECDAIITNKTNIPLMVMVADCTPILLYDQASHAIAAIHAGRAGAFSNIIHHTIAMMKEEFNTKSETIIAVLGPSICQSCYEVNHHIYNEAKSLGYKQSILQKNGKYFLHVNQILKQQLKEDGVKENRIEVINHCKSCENETFFSYSADGGKTGRQAGVIMLQPTF